MQGPRLKIAWRALQSLDDAGYRFAGAAPGISTGRVSPAG